MHSPPKLDWAVRAIRSGRPERTIRRLSRLRARHPTDLTVSYVLAHALELLGESDRAVAIWEQISTQQREQAVPKAPSEAVEFRHSDELTAALEIVLARHEPDDPFEQLVAQLGDAGLSDVPFVNESQADDVAGREEQAELVSETLGRILVAQRKFAAAASVYRTLAEQEPDHSERLLKEAATLQSRAEEEAA